MKIGIITMMYKRHTLTNIVFNYYNDLKKIDDDIELLLFTAGSEGDISKSIAIDNGFIYVETPNNPLSEKINVITLHAKKYNLDGVILIGSDDILNYEYIKMCAHYLSKDKDVLLGVSDIYLAGDGVVKYWGGYTNNRVGETSGAGRLFSTTIMDKLNWKPFSGPNINKGLDGQLTKNLKKRNLKIKTLKMGHMGGYLIDIKVNTDENLTKLSNIPSVEVDRKVVYSKFPLFDFNTIECLIINPNTNKILNQTKNTDNVVKRTIKKHHIINQPIQNFSIIVKNYKKREYTNPRLRGVG